MPKFVLSLFLGHFLFAAPSFATSAIVRFHEEERAGDPRSEAMAAIEAAGGSLTRLAKDSEELSCSFVLRGKAAGDDALASLRALPEVVELNLGKTAITDAGLAHVAALPNLRRLALHETAVGDAGLAHLASLRKLESLNLYGTKVGDAGLVHLRELASLRRLYLWRTEVSEAAAAELAAARPGLAINRGWNEELPVSGTCCEKAKAAGVACKHACCIAAVKEGKVCLACNPPAKEEKKEEVGEKQRGEGKGGEERGRQGEQRGKEEGGRGPGGSRPPGGKP